MHIELDLYEGLGTDKALASATAHALSTRSTQCGMHAWMKAGGTESPEAHTALLALREHLRQCTLLVRGLHVADGVIRLRTSGFTSDDTGFC